MADKSHEEHEALLSENETGTQRLSATSRLGGEELFHFFVGVFED